MKDVYYLPDDLYVKKERRSQDIVVRVYSSQHKTIKNKIVLNMHMINIIVQGRKTVLYPDTMTSVNAGELIILGKGNVLTSEILSAQQGFRSLLFYFSDTVLKSFLKKNDFKGGSAGVNWKVYKQDEFIRDFVRTVDRLMKAPDAFTDAFRLLKLEELLLYLSIHDPSTKAFLQRISSAGSYADFTTIVESNIATPITIDELAFLCNLSRSTFKRRFEETYAMSPQKWFFQQRMLLAGTILKEESVRPSGVYLKVGYDNHSSFSEAFRKFYKMTPTEYRKKG